MSNAGVGDPISHRKQSAPSLPSSPNPPPTPQSPLKKTSTNKHYVQGIQLPKFLNTLPYHLLHLFQLRHIRNRYTRFPADLLDFFGDFLTSFLVGGDVVYADVVAVLGEADRYGAADAAGGTGYYCGFAWVWGVRWGGVELMGLWLRVIVDEEVTGWFSVMKGEFTYPMLLLRM